MPVPDAALAGRAITVLIVGAGPTGLTLALLLTRYGIDVRLVEKRRELSRHTKATNLMQRSLELLDGLGLAESLQAAGGAMDSVELTAYGKVLPPLDMHMTDSAFPDVVLCGQDVFEARTAAALTAAGVEIEFGTELVDLRQHDDGCTVQLRQADSSGDDAAAGEVESVSAAWVIGCDGAAGRTRDFTAMTFQTQRTGVVIRQVDATLHWHRSTTDTQMWLFYADRGFSAVIPLPGGVHRVLHVEPAAQVPAREPTLDEIAARLQHVSGDRSVRLTDKRWGTFTDLAMGVAPALIDGRVVLAGDAGNPVLPNGGQGMNTGIADAFTLAWRLAAVIDGDAPVTLLATYNDERHRLRTALQRTQHATLRYSVLSTPAPARALLRSVASPALRWGGGRAMARAFSELDVTTRHSPLTEQVGRGKGIRAGDRAPDAGLVYDGRSVRLRHDLQTGGWTLLGFTGAGRDADTVGAATALAAVPGVHSLLIATGDVDDVPHGVSLRFDLDAAAHRAYGLRRPALLLVRPDGFVAVRAAPRNADRIAAGVARWGVTGSPRYVDAAAGRNQQVASATVVPRQPRPRAGSPRQRHPRRDAR